MLFIVSVTLRDCDVISRLQVSHIHLSLHFAVLFLDHGLFLLQLYESIGVSYCNSVSTFPQRYMFFAAIV